MKNITSIVIGVALFLVSALCFAKPYFPDCAIDGAGPNCSLSALYTTCVLCCGSTGGTGSDYTQCVAACQR